MKGLSNCMCVLIGTWRSATQKEGLFQVRQEFQDFHTNIPEFQNACDDGDANSHTIERYLIGEKMAFHRMIERMHSASFKSTMTTL